MKRTILCLALVAGCGAGATKPNVRAPAASALAANTTLGRVVVYRNGVAYFERHAHVTGDSLVLTVPADKIDDLLKSLTVVDVRTHQPAPVAYRTDVHAGKDSFVEMTIALSGPAPHDLLLSYIAEAPAWKPSYRVVMSEDGEIDLQGWTVIDNASGEDWNRVRVGVGSSSALSFRHDMRSIKDVPRETLAANAPFATTPRPDGSAAPAPAAPPVAQSTEAIGSAHFESPVPMTVRRGTSAMISILHERTRGEFAYLYDPTATRPDAAFPFRVVRLKNPTNSVLESGPVALFGGGRFIGEGLPEPIPANAVAFIPFAQDRQVVVSRGPGSTAESIAKILTAEHGALQVEMRHATRRSFVLRNRQSEPAIVYVKHSVTPGYRLVTSSSERIGEAQYFRVVVDPNAQADLAIEEEAPIVRAIDVRTRGVLDLVQAFLLTTPQEHPLRARVASLVEIDKKVREGEVRLAAIEREFAAYGARAAELKAQIAELRASKSGVALRRELEKLLAEIERSQSQATAEAAALTDGLRVARIAFQNAAAGLTLAPGG